MSSFNVICRIPLFLLAMCVSIRPCAAFQVRHLSKPGPECPVSVASKSDDTRLSQEIDLDVSAKPLADVLSSISQKSSVGLICDPRVGAQRVTIHLKNQDLRHFMAELVGLLSHNPGSPRGYLWTASDSSGGKPPEYRLSREAISIRDERIALDFPRQQAVHLLRELYTYSRSAPEQQAKYQGDLQEDYRIDPEIQPFRDALRGLSESQFGNLINSGGVEIDGGQFSDQIVAFNKRWHDGVEQQRQAALQSGLKDPYPNGIPDKPPFQPGLTFDVDDYDGEHPERSVLFGLQLRGVSVIENGDMHVVFNPLDDKVLSLPPSAPGEPVFDLGPVLSSPGVSAAQRGDAAFVLTALAHIAKISVYYEHFYKTAYWGAISRGPRITRGTIGELLNAIGKEWGLNVMKNGDTYVLWSRTWARDRSVDVSEHEIDKWRSRARLNGGLTLDDRSEMASAFTFPQLRLTMDLAYPDSGPWDSRGKADTLRFLGGLSKLQRKAATSSRGLEMAGLPKSLSDAFIRRFIPADKVSDAIKNNHPKLFITKMSTAQGQIDITIVKLKGDNGDIIWMSTLAFKGAGSAVALR